MISSGIRDSTRLFTIHTKEDVEAKGWNKGQELKIRFNEGGNLELEEDK